MEAVTQFMKPAIDYWLVTDRFKDIQGYLNAIEGYALHTTAAFGPGDGDVLEIGSLYGRSTCYLASGCARNGRGVVYAVDTFTGSEEHQEGEDNEQDAIVNDGTTFKIFLRNIAQHRLDDRVKPIPQASDEAVKGWEGPIRLLFIDGDHSYDGTRDDFVNWNSFVTENGLIAFHDVDTWDGVTEFYNELLEKGEWTEVLSVGALRMVQRSQ